MTATGHRSHLDGAAASRLWLAYDSFILSLEAAHRAERTIAYYHEKLRPFVIWLEAHGVAEVAGIQADHIRAFLLAREKTGLAAITIHHHAACIKAWCNFLRSSKCNPEQYRLE
jgi:site-specific recombinase XerD